MPPYIRLSDILLRYHQTLHQDRSYFDPPRRTGAGMLALALYGEAVYKSPALLNSAALALAQERLTVHRVDAPTIAQVQQTEVRALPSEPPQLLRTGWAIETADLSQPLFADVVCLGGYALEEQAWVMGYRYPDGVFVGQWRPRWGDMDIEGAFYETLPLLISNVGKQRDLTLQSIQFALTLGALLDAEGTPLDSRTERVATGTPKRKPAPRNPHAYAWSVRHIRLNERGASVPATPAAEATAASAEPRDGLRPEKRAIRGYLRRQPFGPGRAERKWVYIAGFEATRYMGGNPLRVIVEEKDVEEKESE